MTYLHKREEIVIWRKNSLVASFCWCSYMMWFLLKHDLFDSLFFKYFGKWLLKLSLLSSFLLLLFSISLSFVFMAMEAVTHVSRCYLSGFTSIWLLENNDCFNDDNNNDNSLGNLRHYLAYHLIRMEYYHLHS